MVPLSRTELEMLQLVCCAGWFFAWQGVAALCVDSASVFGCSATSLLLLRTQHMHMCVLSHTFRTARCMIESWLHTATVQLSIGACMQWLWVLLLHARVFAPSV